MRARQTLVVCGAAALVALGAALLLRAPPAPCATGFVRAGPRCLPAASCPPPLVATDHGCDAGEHDVVLVLATSFTVGPSDWEAEGRVPPRTVTVATFAIDRLEVTAGRACGSAVFRGAPFCDEKDAARAAFGVTLAKARAYCTERGGRLPTDDEWLAAAGPRRYPWGDTGAVCRRGAWGLASGPCGEGGAGPDTVGAHPDGATALGVHDLAGNVEEWVEAPDCGGPGARCAGAVRGGSWRTKLATELRTWLRREVASPDVADPTIGLRCAYAEKP